MTCITRPILFISLALLHFSATAAPSHPCASAATTQARKLLAFHFGSKEDFNISSEVKILPPVKNPAAKEQLFDVLEVWGSLYKGQYRMRLLYGRLSSGECILMGQEILEYAKL
jgi:hypothetical protein